MSRCATVQLSQDVPTVHYGTLSSDPLVRFLCAAYVTVCLRCQEVHVAVFLALFAARRCILYCLFSTRYCTIQINDCTEALHVMLTTTRLNFRFITTLRSTAKRRLWKVLAMSLCLGNEILFNSAVCFPTFLGRTIAPLIVCFDLPAGVVRWGFPLYRTVFIWILIVPYSFHQDSHCTAHFSILFQWYRT